MDKTAIKNFSIWARKKLIEDITYKAGLIGVSEKGIAQSLSQSTKDLQFFDIGTKDYAQVAGKEIEQRNGLIKVIKEKERDLKYADAFNEVIEEIAYTWFNRLVAIRFMEVNDYLPSRVRVLSSENPAKNEPDFVTTPFDTDLEFTSTEQDRIMQLKDENKLDELFRMLFIKQCNKLNEILPEMFEQTSDYTELLLGISFTDNDGIVYHLTHDIDEADWQDQVQIIGWLYQYYNIELKDDTFALLKKNVKITKERIPAATQLFTPDWIVRYMVENSLGRLWVEGHPNDDLKANWKYYLEEAEQEVDVQAQLEKIRGEYRNLNPEDIKVIDPCMGSGHILVYCFDVLMQIYESQGYTQRDAAQSIAKNNLFGLDIDKRAAQLAYFAVMMKARQYDRRFFDRGIAPNVYVIRESNGIDCYTVEYFCNGDSKLKKAINTLIDELHDAKEYGSILDVTYVDFLALYARFDEIQDDIHLSRETALKELYPMVKVAEVMAQKYEVIVTNPPYMGASGMSARLSQYVKDNYPDSKTDMYSVFIEKCSRMTVCAGFQAMITQHTWMFLSSFEKLRDRMLTFDMVNMAHLGPRAFEEIGGEVVQTASFVIRNTRIRDYISVYSRLVTYNSQQSKENAFIEHKELFYTKQTAFSMIPGSPMSYWANDVVLEAFARQKTIGDVAKPRLGFATGDNDRFMRFWYEPCYSNIGFNYRTRESASLSGKRWFPTNKGGNYRKWYGNFELVVNWENDGTEIRNFKDENGKLRSRPQNLNECFSDGISWTVITNHSSFRYSPIGMLYNNKGPILGHREDENNFLFMGLLNSTVTEYILQLLSPTLGFESGYVSNIPYIMPAQVKGTVLNLVKECISLTKNDWDSYETSWDFQRNPLIKTKKINDSVKLWRDECKNRFDKLKNYEEQLNSIFIDAYGLNNVLTEKVESESISIRLSDEKQDVKSLISYAVGCMFGRYSLDVEGLAYAGGEWNDSKYSTFIPDKDNCIPITDEPYFEDDIVGLFCVWLKKVYGEDTLEENLDFIAKALGNKGSTSREVIRNYFLSDFIKDHIKTYQKRPIYWLFDSGKQNGFKALVYMHRWDADTVGNLRVEYLHKMQHTYEREIQRMQETIDDGRDAREVSKATKRKDKLQKQLKEIKDYDVMLAHIALSRIEIDLDDGVKVNYEKVQTGRDGKKTQILVKI